MKKITAFFIAITFIFCISTNVLAGENQKYITIVNPVRISRYNRNPAQSLKNEYQAILSNNLPATWLFTYGSLKNKDILSITKNMDSSQEFGIFLEVTPTFAKDTNINYNDGGFWHHANSVFLSGYTKSERIIFIDKVFEEFKKVFGYYPKSIGSWWTDAFSLEYIKDKYGVVANLVCADQFLTDGYRIWGQPWQMAYYPSVNHPAVPASSEENKLDLINLQWASRDPLNGYDSSLYSTQDYLVTGKNLNIEYFKKIIDLYLNTKELGQITLGLEADLDESAYLGEYARQMEVIKKYAQDGVNILTMSQFYEKYKDIYPQVSPSTLVESEDFLGTNKKSVWFTSPNYRLFYVKDKDNDVIQIKDLRVYDKNFLDPYFSSPNYEFQLSINIPSVIDSIQNPDDIWYLPFDAEIITEDEKIIIKGKGIKVPDRIKSNTLIKLKKNSNQLEISFNPIIMNNTEGVIEKGYSSESLHFFRSIKSLLGLAKGKGWQFFKKVDYLIPQGEIYALNYLSSLPAGKVMVYDNECLQCSWHTQNKPIAFSNLRSYVKKYSNHRIEYNNSVFNAKNIEEAQKEFRKVSPNYIYLVKFEAHKEKLPFSPGDLGVRLIYSNANAEVWKVDEK